MSWFDLPPLVRALALGGATFLVGMLVLLPLMRGLEGIGRGGRAALAAVPAGFISAAALALGGAVGALHPWPFWLAAATGLVPIGIMAIGGWAVPAYRARQGGPTVELPPPPLPSPPGRDKPLGEAAATTPRAPAPPPEET
jgi:hypothetical protein